MNCLDSACIGSGTFSSMVPVVRKRYTYTLFFWPSRHTLAAACLSFAGFLHIQNGRALKTPFTCAGAPCPAL